MKVRFIMVYQSYAKGDEDTVSDEKGKKLIYRGIAEKIEKKKKKDVH